MLTGHILADTLIYCSTTIVHNVNLHDLICHPLPSPFTLWGEWPLKVDIILYGWFPFWGILSGHRYKEGFVPSTDKHAHTHTLILHQWSLPSIVVVFQFYSWTLWMTVVILFTAIVYDCRFCLGVLGQTRCMLQCPATCPYNYDDVSCKYLSCTCML